MNPISWLSNTFYFSAVKNVVYGFILNIFVKKANFSFQQNFCVSWWGGEKQLLKTEKKQLLKKICQNSG